MHFNYNASWLIFVNIVPFEGYRFSDLVEADSTEEYSGAWANIIVRTSTIEKALIVLSKGLQELNFKVEFIDKVENVQSLVENNELSESVHAEVDWLLQSEYVFKISDKLFPYHLDL